MDRIRWAPGITLTSAANNFVPSLGYPSADILITSGLAGTSGTEPAIPTGRLSAITEQEVFDYLAKVVEYEMLQDFVAIPYHR